MFMVPLGVSLAMTVRIGHALGAGEGARVRSIGTLGYALCLAFALVSAALMLAFPVSIVRFYTHDAAVLPIAVGLIGMAAVFQVSDALQVAALGALRGLRDTRGPMLINAAAYWGIGFPCAWIFGIALHHGPRAVWAGLVLGLTLAAVLLLRRFYQLDPGQVTDPLNPFGRPSARSAGLAAYPIPDPAVDAASCTRRFPSRRTECTQIGQWLGSGRNATSERGGPRDPGGSSRSTSCPSQQTERIGNRGRVVVRRARQSKSGAWRARKHVVGEEGELVFAMGVVRLESIPKELDVVLLAFRFERER